MLSVVHHTGLLLFIVNDGNLQQWFEKDNGLKLYLLDYPIEDIKFIFEQICEQVLQATYYYVSEKSIN